MSMDVAYLSSGNPAGFGLFGMRGIVGVEVAVATEVSAPSSLGGGHIKRGIDDDEAFRDSGLDGPLAVTTGSAVVWVVVAAGTLTTTGATVELSLLTNLQNEVSAMAATFKINPTMGSQSSRKKCLYCVHDKQHTEIAEGRLPTGEAGRILDGELEKTSSNMV